jgi:hypothetical protein
MPKRKASCYMVVGYYAGDRPGRSKPRGNIYGVHNKAGAERHAAHLQRKAGGQAANTIYEAVSCDRAPKRFKLRA